MVEGEDFVERRVGHDAGHQRGVHGVASAFGDDVAQQGPAEQGQIANQVERLVASALVRHAEALRVQYSSSRKANCVFE